MSKNSKISAVSSISTRSLPGKRRSFVYARLHGISTATRAYEHLVGAYGVVGLSGVKDARKSVQIADALASADFSVGWLRGEVMEWLNSRPRAEFNGLDAVERRRRARGSRAAV